MPTFPEDQKAVIRSEPEGVENPFPRPHNQSITAFGARDSFLPPTVGAPCESPVPGDDE